MSTGTGVANVLGRASENAPVVAVGLPSATRDWPATGGRRLQLTDEELDAPDLHGFLSGAERTAVADLTVPLRELQDNRCFCCDRPLPEWRRDAITILGPAVQTLLEETL